MDATPVADEPRPACHDRPSVLLVTSIRLYADGISRALDELDAIGRIAVAASCAAALAHLQGDPMDVVVLDLAGINDKTAAQSFVHAAAPAPVVALAVREQDQDVVAWAERGAMGIVTQQASFDDLRNAILSAAVGPEPPEELEKLTETMQAYLDGHPAEDPVVNPLVADLSGLPPMLAQAASGDLILPDARALVERAVEHGVDAQIELYTADTHVFHVFWSFLPEAADALQRAGGFARAALTDRPRQAAS